MSQLTSSSPVPPTETPGRTSIVAFVVYTMLVVPAQAATIQITIDKLVFSPAEVSAKVGDTIEWINKDPLAHTATAANGDWNVVMGPRQSGKVVLTKPGSADYFCKYHPNMKGRVVATP